MRSRGQGEPWTLLSVLHLVRGDGVGTMAQPSGSQEAGCEELGRGVHRQPFARRGLSVRGFG